MGDGEVVEAEVVGVFEPEVEVEVKVVFDVSPTDVG